MPPMRTSLSPVPLRRPPAAIERPPGHPFRPERGGHDVHAAAVALVVSLTVTPMREEMRLMRQEMRQGFEQAPAPPDADAE